MGMNPNKYAFLAQYGLGVRLFDRSQTGLALSLSTYAAGNVVVSQPHATRYGLLRRLNR